MSECKPHCPEHEDRTRIIAENTACINAIKRERETQFRYMREIQTDIYGKLEHLEKAKVDMGTFKWIMSGLGAIAVLILVTLMAQFGTMTSIQADMRVMAAELKGGTHGR